MRKRFMHLKALVLLTLVVPIGPSTFASGSRVSEGDVWTSISRDELETRKAERATPWIRPDRFEAFELEPSALDVVLIASPLEFTIAAEERPAVLALPRPDGRFERFAIVESPVMHPDLEKRMADEGWRMKTYSGTSLEDPAVTVRFDWGGPAGFHAMVHSPDGDFFIDPYWQGDARLYVSYYRRDYTLQGEGKPIRCEVGATAGTSNPYEVLSDPNSPIRADTGGVLRTYRLAVAATGEYTANFGGTKAGGQAAVTTSVNRVNMVYERELSVRMMLVPNNLDIIFTDGGTDPYSNNTCSSTMLDENQTAVDNAIGDANYDIGHVFGKRTGGGGGLAQGQSVCSTGGKAKGCSSVPNPMGDGFDVGIVGHEVGHQFGAGHTFTGQGGSCTAAFASNSAYEPGSGSTIMSYFGLCDAADNLKPPTGDYFHRISLDQMGTFINDPAGGGSCDTPGAIINPNEPTVNAGADYTIPQGTPFELTGTASDPDGDMLTFNWEQFDLGLQKPLATGDDGVQPIFRSYPSATSPTRVFPRLEDLIAGTIAPGETLPATDRTMNFRMTARDNRAGGGRENDDAAAITSTTTAGPFRVTAPNGGETFAGGSAQTVTWDVAGTSGVPVSAANVDILLSHDGGATYAETLASNTPNDGSEGVTIPTTVSTASGRVKVKGAGNVFFDISDTDFAVDARCQSPSVGIPNGGSIDDTMTIAGGKTIADLNVKLDIDHTWVGELIVTLQHVDTGTSVTLLDEPGVPALPSGGCFYDNVLADLDDEGFAPAENECANTGLPDPGPPSPPAVANSISGRLTPNNPLSAFDMEDIGGDWKLTVTDTEGTFGETGTLIMWCLDGAFGGGGCPTNLVLANQTLSGAQTYKASVSATLGPSLIVNGTDIVVNAPAVLVVNNVEVRGTFRIGNTTSCP